MSDPLSEIAEFLRARFGRPSPDVERVIEAFAALVGARTEEAHETAAAPVPDDLVARLDAIEARITKLEAAAPAADASSDLHRRLAALEAARPARATAPAAKPASASA